MRADDKSALSHYSSSYLCICSLSLFHFNYRTSWFAGVLNEDLEHNSDTRHFSFLCLFIALKYGYHRFTAQKCPVAGCVVGVRGKCEVSVS